MLSGKDLERVSASRSKAPTQLHELAPSGRVIQLSGDLAGARTSCAAQLLARRQLQGETAAWITPTHTSVYPPDLDGHGVDLEALLFIRLPDTTLPYGACRAAELLLQSGAFGILIIDLSTAAPPSHEQAWLSRLAGAARHHNTLVVLLTACTRPHASPTSTHPTRSMGPLVFLHSTPIRRRNGEPGGYEVHHDVHKYKAGPLPSLIPTHWRGPWGVR